jgi:tetratricopeptide (TPR) repeat protein
MWPDVAASNTVAYKAAMDLSARMHLQEGREDFHTLSWLEYANLMMGKFDEAKKNVELAKQAADRNAANQGIRDAYLGMRARYLLETAQWEKIPLEAAPTSGADAHAGMPGMAGMGQYGGSGTWVFITGVSAAKLGDTATADAAEARLKGLREKAEGGNAYGAKPVAIMEKELAAYARLARGQKDEAVGLAKEATDIELSMSPPSGPPDPIKPALELYGEVLLEADRPAEAAAAFEQSLFRTPNRTPSVKGLERARAKTGTTTASR